MGLALHVTRVVPGSVWGPVLFDVPVSDLGRWGRPLSLGVQVSPAAAGRGIPINILGAWAAL